MTKHKEAMETIEKCMIALAIIFVVILIFNSIKNDIDRLT